MFRNNRYRRHSMARKPILLLLVLLIGFVIGAISEPALPANIKHLYVDVQNGLLDLTDSDAIPVYLHENKYHVVDTECRPEYLSENSIEELAEMLVSPPKNLTLQVSIDNYGDTPTKRETALASFRTNNPDEIIRKRVSTPSLPANSSYDVVVTGPAVFRGEPDVNKIRMRVTRCDLITSAGLITTDHDISVEIVR